MAHHAAAGVTARTLTGTFLEDGLFCKGGALGMAFGTDLIGGNFVVTWLAFGILTLGITFLTSGPLFYAYYWKTNVTYEKWTRKSNPKFPTPEKVRDEIVQMCKGVFCAALCPAMSVWLAHHGLSKAYCGSPPGYGTGYHVATFLVVMLVSDFWEFFYHYLGHRHKALWEVHKHHHVFFNPSPFAVIADEFVDQFMRATPLLLFPLVAPINIDLMFFEYGAFFYIYGCYLHWGYEFDWPDAHHPVLNTAFQHYAHHAVAYMGKPHNCGFFFKIWDQLFGSCYDRECFCVKCQRAQGKRSPEAFKTVEIPDYSVLLEPSFWLQRKVLTGTTSQEKNSAIPASG
mmetsp:Transcript_96158/g.271882  ORF Transcript_96158/g.271882 Transcript_96158/m.271882 type:complete len:342 (-) Transcript_96158:213-1238(-)